MMMIRKVDGVRTGYSQMSEKIDHFYGGNGSRFEMDIEKQKPVKIETICNEMPEKIVK